MHNSLGYWMKPQNHKKSVVYTICIAIANIQQQRNGTLLFNHGIVLVSFSSGSFIILQKIKDYFEFSWLYIVGIELVVSRNSFPIHLRIFILKY